MQNYEKLGAFYLGRMFDPQRNAPMEDLLLYDSKDLTTHALCVGMTGSGKTGLCISLLEEAAIDGIPALIIDPKGDLGNMLLAFPDLKPRDFRPWIDEGEAARKGVTPDEFAAQTASLWKKGLADWGQDPSRLAKYRDAADISIFTPGSRSGLPLSVLRSFDAPPKILRDDPDALRDRIMAGVSGLLALLGLDTDPLQSREHILLSNILQHAWGRGRSLDIPSLIREVQAPPFDKVGVFDLESFYAEKDRFSLAMSLNNLLASPGFSAWLEGSALDIGRLLYSETGKPRLSILSIAHLSDPERMFFVTLLLNEVIAWMRTQSGTSSLRALLYMDEIYGYFPPTAVPPSKTPMLTLLKQARAFGLGIVLSTQNPVDLDYKGLSNAGTWFIGRLQTERDKARVLDGLEGASVTAGLAFDRGKMEATISGLGKRVFLMHNVHDDHPVLFHTRWALSYLRGPLTRSQIQTLMDPKREALQPAAGTAEPDTAASAPPPSRPAVQTTGQDKPLLPPEISEFFLVSRSAPLEGGHILFKPGLYALSKLHFVNTSLKLDVWREESRLAALDEYDLGISWDEARIFEKDALDLGTEGPDRGRFAPLPDSALSPPSYRKWKRDLAAYLYQNMSLKLWKSRELGMVSQPGETESEFRIRLGQSARERRDLDVEKLNKKYTPKLARLEERLRKAQSRVDREKSQYDQRKIQTAISIGATILGGLLGRKVTSRSNIGRATTSMRDVGRASREKQDIERAKQDVLALREQMEELEREFQNETEKLRDRLSPDALDLEEIDVKPRKSDIQVSDPVLVWTPWRVDSLGIAEPDF